MFREVLKPVFYDLFSDTDIANISTEDLLTEDGDPILTESGERILVNT